MRSRKFALLVGLLIGTSAARAQGPSLGDAASFAIVGGTGVSSSGPTRVTGNVGVSPGKAVSGLPKPVVGDIYLNDATAKQAQADATAAYQALGGSCQPLTTGHPVAGTYCVSQPLAGTLALQGDKDSVWIFRSAGPLTTEPDFSVDLEGGAYSGHVFWRVEGSAHLATRTAFVGTILARDDITLGYAAILNGRALAQKDTVTLDTNEVTFCCEPIRLPDITSKQQYNEPIIATGGTPKYTFSLFDGSLRGLRLTPDGVLSGTAAPGTTSFTLLVTDSRGCSGIRMYTINTCPVLTIGDLHPLKSGCITYDETINVSGGTEPYKFSATMPEGSTLSEDGRLVGNCAPITVTVVDAAGCTTTRTYGGCPNIVIDTNLAPGIVGTEYNATLTATGGSAPYTFLLCDGALPEGLSPLISGIPTKEGGSTFTVTAIDNNGQRGSRTYKLPVHCPNITVTAVNGTVGTPYNEKLVASGGTANYEFSGSVPPGFAPLSTDGTLSGAPTQPGTNSYPVTVTDFYGCTVTTTYSFTVSCPTITLSAPFVITLPASSATTVQLAAGPLPLPYTFTPASGPAGITLTSTGMLAIPPLSPGDRTFTVTATHDASGCAGTQTYTIRAVAAPVPGAPIPTVSTWALVALCLLIVAVALRRIG